MKDTRHWVGTWTATPAPSESGLGFANHTLRMMPRVSIGGDSLRIRVSNAYGAGKLNIGAAYVGIRDKGSAIMPGSDRKLTFCGADSATIAAGALAISDTVRLDVTPLADLAVTLYLPDEIPDVELKRAVLDELEEHDRDRDDAAHGDRVHHRSTGGIDPAEISQHGGKRITQAPRGRFAAAATRSAGIRSDRGARPWRPGRCRRRGRPRRRTRTPARRPRWARRTPANWGSTWPRSRPPRCPSRSR